MQAPVAAAIAALAAALWKPMRHDRGRLRGAFVLLFLWALAFLLQRWHGAEEIATALLALAAVQVIAVATFDIALRRVRMPKFISEMVILATYASILFNLLFRLGVNVTGIFATSAVAAAVVGLALQDMLSNVAGGIVLELEGGVNVGDYVRCGDHSGWVQHVRLRHTAIRTSDGDTVILPNSQLTRSALHVASRQHRLFVPFPMSYTGNPQQLIEAAEHALRSSPLPGVLASPAPQCVVREMDGNCIRYAAVLWTDTPGRETELVSAVLVRLYFALERAGMPAAEISHVVEMKSADAGARGLLDPLAVLRCTPILRLLDESDLLELAAGLKHLSFAPGEHIIREGDEGSSMYFIAAGQVSIAVHPERGVDRAISVMETGDFFGEASLLTGERRSASVIARTRVACYRLDKESLHNVMTRRAELAEDMAVVMTHRQAELTAAREQLSLETAMLREASGQTQLLSRIRRFFGITASGARA